MDISKFKTIYQGIFLAFVSFIPILFLPLSFLTLEPTKNFAFLIMGVLFFLGAIIYKIKQDSFFVSKNIFLISFFVLILSSVFSVIFSNNVAISLVGRQISNASFFGFISLCTIVYTTYILFDDIKSKTKLFQTIYVSSVAVVVLHLFSILIPFFPSLGFFVNNTNNTIGSWYDLGFFALFVTLSSVLVLQFFKHLQFYKVIGWIGFVAGLILMIFVNSLVIFSVAALFSLLYIIFRAMSQTNLDSKEKVSYESLSVLIVSIVFILIGAKTGVLLNSTFNLQAVELRPSLVSTLEVAGKVYQSEPVLQKIFGVGLDRFDIAWLMYKPSGVNMSQYWDTDFKYGFSTVTSLAVTTGIFGVLAWLLFIGVSIYFAFKLISTSFNSKQKSDLFIHLYSVLGYIFFLTVIIIYTPSIILIALMFVFMGLFTSNLVQTKLIVGEKVSITKNPRISFAYILVLVLLLIGFIYIGYVHVSQYSSRVLFERANAQYIKDGDIQKMEQKVLASQFIFNSDIYSRALTEIGLIKINQVLENKSLTQEQAIGQFTEILRNTIGYAQSAIMYDPQSYINRISLISVYKNLIPLGVTDAKDESIKLIDATATLTPQNPTLLLEKARVYTLSKDYDFAIEQIKKAVELKPNYVDAVFLLSQIQVEKGNVDEAIRSIQAAIAVDNLNPNLRFQLGLLYYNQQKFNDAVITLENAIKLSPQFANAKYFLGLSYYKNNRTTDSIKIFEDLNKQIPDNQEVQFILNNLKAGQDPFAGAQPPLTTAPENRQDLPLDDKNVETKDKEE